MCQRIPLPQGGYAIVCGGPRFHAPAPEDYICKVCGKPAAFLCDWKMPDRESGTCDAPMCPEHALQVAKNKHLCTWHQAAYKIWKEKHDRQGELFA